MTTSPSHEASFSGPESKDAAEALSRQTGTLRPGRVVAVIFVLGVVLTGLAAYAVARVDRNTEQRLLEGQSRQAATVLSNAIMTIEQPMTATLEALSVSRPGETPENFSRLFARNVGPDALFLGAQLWQDESTFTQAASIGEPAGLDPQSTELQDFLDHAMTTQGPVVRLVVVGEQLRIAYALADADRGRVIYAERAIPADRRSPVDRDSAFSELHYAIYLGRTTDSADLTTTDVDPADLPLEGITYESEIPFGDTVLTLVTSPRRHLGSPLSQLLPFMLLIGGMAMTGIAALVARQLVGSRVRAEDDTETITTLYQRVDSLYGEQRDLFVRLQRALLPQATPNIAGIELGTEYVAGAQGIDIGGDWYSVIGIGGSRFAFVVGDVSGNGVDAVAEMARARFTLRAYLLEGHAPGAALERCSAQFDVTTDGHIVTALVGIGDRDTGEVTVANAGHPLPLLASSRGTEFVSMPVGPPLGAGLSSYESVTFTMPSGSMLLCYTDGLIERRGETIDDGMRRLAETVAGVVEQPLDSLIAEVIAAMRDTRSADDIAVLAVRRVESRSRLTADAQTPAVARAFVQDRLTGRTLPDGALVEDVVLATSELVTNAVRAGASFVDLELKVTADRIELAVTDDADGWPEMGTASTDDVGGRGLRIVDSVSDSLDVAAAGTGKRVAVRWLGRRPVELA